MSSIDQTFGIHARALELYGRRAETLAANMANADTPGYQARDVDFTAALQEAVAGEEQGLVRRDARHLGPVEGAGTDSLKYRVPLQPSADGNTVDLQGEQMRFTENAIRHQASVTFLDARIRLLMTAIRGE